MLASWSGLRPLVRDPSAPPGDTKSLSRNHVIVPNADSGLVSILGGKWTTYRRMAEEAVDAAVKMHSLRAGPCKSRELAIVGTEYFQNNHDTDHTIMLREKCAKIAAHALRCLFLHAVCHVFYIYFVKVSHGPKRRPPFSSQLR